MLTTEPQHSLAAGVNVLGCWMAEATYDLCLPMSMTGKGAPCQSHLSPQPALQVFMDGDK